MKAGERSFEQSWKWY